MIYSEVATHPLDADFAVIGDVVTPSEVINDGVILVRQGKIQAVGARREFPVLPPTLHETEGFLVPGFVDLHVHGGAGADFMDGTPEAVRTILSAHARHGTTAIFPTTTTGTPTQIEAMLAATASVQTCWEPQQGARIAGVHLYGPFFAPDKVGCHDPHGRRDPDRAEYERYFATGLVKIATCAAELAGAGEFYRMAHENGCLITCGHSNSSWQEMEAAFAAGMRHVDHFWCAMSSVVSLRGRFGTPMQASMEQFVLANPEVSTEVLADGEHLAPELLRFAYQMKGATRLCLVTDSSRALDCPPGLYSFGSSEGHSQFMNDGRAGRTPDGGLASSVVGMDTMLRIMMKAGVPLLDAVRMATLTPAERAGIAAHHGSLEVGKVADFVVMDASFQVQQVWIDGQLLRSSA